MSVTAWIILILIFSFASFFMSALLCASGRDEEKAKAYKRGLKDGLAKKL
jgi:hypothetical protein